MKPVKAMTAKIDNLVNAFLLLNALAVSITIFGLSLYV